MDNLELCNTTIGYEIDEGTLSLILDGDNCQNRLKELVNTIKADEYVFFSRKCKEKYIICNFANSTEVKIKPSDNSSLTIYQKDCYDEDSETDIMSCSEENNKEKKDMEEYENQTLIFGLIGLSAAVLVGIASFIIFLLKRRGILCFKTENQDIIVHQNVLYGNLSNEEYFAGRYDTNVVDRNQYYEEEYES